MIEFIDIERYHPLVYEKLNDLYNFGEIQIDRAYSYVGESWVYRPDLIYFFDREGYYLAMTISMDEGVASFGYELHLKGWTLPAPAWKDSGFTTRTKALDMAMKIAFKTMEKDLKLKREV